MVFENRIPRRIFEPKSDVKVEWRNLHNKKIHSLYRSPNLVWMIKSLSSKRTRHIDRMEKDASAFKILTGNPTEKRRLGMPRRI